jgi:RNA polymerase sigma-70 factor (ECF subfamily)
MHSGDPEAARSLWAAHAGRMMALARAITGSHADALDAVQEAFVAVLALSRDEVGGIEDAPAYLTGAVRGRALNIVRSATRRARHERNGETDGGPALRLVGAADEDPALEAALAELPLDAREAVALKHIAGMTFDQMATAMGLPRATVASRYYAAIEQLRAAMDVQRPAAKEVARA